MGDGKDKFTDFSGVVRDEDRRKYFVLVGVSGDGLRRRTYEFSYFPDIHDLVLREFLEDERATKKRAFQPVFSWHRSRGMIGKGEVPATDEVLEAAWGLFAETLRVDGRKRTNIGRK